jgi:hypothetical protein
MLLFSLYLSLSLTHAHTHCIYVFLYLLFDYIFSLYLPYASPLYIFSLYPTLSLSHSQSLIFPPSLCLSICSLSLYISPLSLCICSFPSVYLVSFSIFLCMASISLPISLSPLFLFLHWLSFAPILVVFNADDNCW